MLEWSKSGRLAILSAKFVTGWTAENEGLGVATAAAAEEFSLIAEGDILYVASLKARNCFKVLHWVNAAILVVLDNQSQTLTCIGVGLTWLCSDDMTADLNRSSRTVLRNLHQQFGMRKMSGGYADFYEVRCMVPR